MRHRPPPPARARALTLLASLGALAACADPVAPDTAPAPVPPAGGAAGAADVRLIPAESIATGAAALADVRRAAADLARSTDPARRRQGRALDDALAGRSRRADAAGGAEHAGPAATDLSRTEAPLPPELAPPGEPAMPRAQIFSFAAPLVPIVGGYSVAAVGTYAGHHATITFDITVTPHDTRLSPIRLLGQSYESNVMFGGLRTFAASYRLGVPACGYDVQSNAAMRAWNGGSIEELQLGYGAPGGPSAVVKMRFPANLAQADHAAALDSETGAQCVAACPVADDPLHPAGYGDADASVAAPGGLALGCAAGGAGGGGGATAPAITVTVCTGYHLYENGVYVGSVVKECHTETVEMS